MMLTLVSVLAACTDSDKERGQRELSDVSAPANTDRVSEYDVTAAVAAPLVSFSFEIDKAATVMHLVALSESGRLRLSEIIGPNGRSIFDVTDTASRKYSAAGEFQAQANVFNYPFGDPAVRLVQGRYVASYELEQIGNTPISDAELAQIRLRVFTKSDSDQQTGVVNITLLYGDVVSNSKELRDSVEKVIQLTQDHLQRAGIRAFLERVELPELPEVLPDPVIGDVLYREIARESNRGLQVYFGTDARGTGGQLNRSVRAGSSPAPLIATSRSAIVVSLAKAAGSDGRFDGPDRNFHDDSEFDLLADNLSHEIFHALGLRDSVTFTGATVSSTDGLDSEKCTSSVACQQNKGASENVMFPYALKRPDVDGQEFFPRYRVSDQQTVFANRHIAVQ